MIEEGGGDWIFCTSNQRANKRKGKKEVLVKPYILQELLLVCISWFNENICKLQMKLWSKDSLNIVLLREICHESATTFSLSPPNFFFQLQGILQRCVLMVCLHSVPVRVPSRVPRPQSPSLATQTLHCHSPQSDLRSFFPVFRGDVKFRSMQIIPS